MARSVMQKESIVAFVCGCLECFNRYIFFYKSFYTFPSDGVWSEDLDAHIFQYKQKIVIMWSLILSPTKRLDTIFPDAV